MGKVKENQGKELQKHKKRKSVGELGRYMQKGELYDKMKKEKRTETVPPTRPSSAA